MKKVHGAILICDVLFVTAAIFTSVIDVFLGIEMADADTHRIKMSILWQDCVFKKDVRKTQRKIKLEFERHGVNVENDNDFIHPPNVCLTCDVRKDNRAQISILTSVCHAEVGTSSTVLQRDEKLAPR